MAYSTSSAAGSVRSRFSPSLSVSSKAASEAPRNRQTRSTSESSSDSSTTSAEREPVVDIPTNLIRRSEYAAYAALLQRNDGLSRRARAHLPYRLLQLSTPRSSAASSPTPTSSAGDETLPGDTNAGIAEDADARVNDRLDARWPLDLSVLPQSKDWDEVIRSAAARMIQDEGLVKRSIDPEDVHDHEDQPVPLDIVERTTEFVNRVLVSLALVRPVEKYATRKRFAPIGWEGVLGAASLCEVDRTVVEQANARLKQIYHAQDQVDPGMGGQHRGQPDDVLQHRLDILTRVREERPPPSMSELYAPILPSPVRNRSHLSKKEIERRENRRKAKEAERKAKEQARIEAKRRKAAVRRAKRADTVSTNS